MGSIGQFTYGVPALLKLKNFVRLASIIKSQVLAGAIRAAILQWAQIMEILRYGTLTMARSLELWEIIMEGLALLHGMDPL